MFYITIKLTHWRSTILYLLFFQEKNPSKSRSSKYVDPKDSPGYSKHREDESSPSRPSPRYHSKTVYSEREKDRMARSKMFFLKFIIQNKRLNISL